MKPLSIVCATSLAGGRDAFSTLGAVTLLPEGEITNEVIRNADVLATRSKTRINDALLEGSSIQFYGTATAGTDHMDLAALKRRGIAWSAAPGSNANSVAEYVIAALARVGRERGIDWAGKTMAIVGVGHVGSRLAALAPVLGLKVRLNDPPRRDASDDPALEPLGDVIATADVVTLHVPLTDDGPYPTRGMVDENFLRAMKPGAVFINAARGEVVREPALLEAARAGRFSAVVLDVFDHEPDLAPAMLAIATIATPHIAGYSLDGRLLGTAMIYRAACRHFGREPVWRIPFEAQPQVIEAGRAVDAILSAYDPRRDDEALRACPAGIAPGKHFNQLRKQYPERREFKNFRIAARAPMPDNDRRALRRLGFASCLGGDL